MTSRKNAPRLTGPRGAKEQDDSRSLGAASGNGKAHHFAERMYQVFRGLERGYYTCAPGAFDANGKRKAKYEHVKAALTIEDSEGHL